LIEDYFAFLTTMSEEDAVVARHDDRTWVGRITGGPEYSEDSPRLRRPVEWSDATLLAGALPAEALAQPGLARLVIDLTAERNAIEALFDEDLRIVDEPQEIVLPRATDELAAEVHISKDWLDEYIGLLESRRQLIIYGPPGTGKTFVAQKVARHVAGKEQAIVVQFHPSYAYEDFFEGLRPGTVDGKVSFQLSPGPLRRIASLAAKDSSHPYVLIIDEINRADIAKVFGELYYLLEYRSEWITLQYSEESFALPKNLYIIGTMNTTDRSIALVDAAIRRRFPFIELHPSQEPVSGVLASYLSRMGSSLERAELLSELNSQLTGKLREFQIGPSYLMRQEADTEEGLDRIWRYDILPLLEEQLYGTHDRDQVHANFGLAAIRQGVEAKRQASQLAEPVQLAQPPEAAAPAEPIQP
jgi:5-methylcytosine-specific restriction protein B